MLSVCVSAANDELASKVLATHDGGPDIRELNWINRNFMDKQRETVNELTATHFGKRMSGDRSDLALLQRVVNEELIESTDTPSLQALGVVLGDVFVNENKNLQWRVYEDDLGATQAVCVRDSKNCLFPITMLSRRMEVGLKPDIDRIYATNLDELKPYLPKLPFSAK